MARSIRGRGGVVSTIRCWSISSRPPNATTSICAPPASRIREARSLYGIAAADLYPELNAQGEAEFLDGNQANSSGLPVSDQNFYSLGLDFGWEIDLWGKVRRGMQAAEFDLQAQIEDARDILVTIRAEVARSYIEARSLQGADHGVATDRRGPRPRP